MKHKYSELDLVRLSYKEMEATEYLEILFTIDSNPELKDVYAKMVESKQSLPAVQFKPSVKSLKLIQAYSQL